MKQPQALNALGCTEIRPAAGAARRRWGAYEKYLEARVPLSLHKHGPLQVHTPKAQRTQGFLGPGVKGQRQWTGKGEGGRATGRAHSDQCCGSLVAACRWASCEGLSRGPQNPLPWRAGDGGAWCVISISHNVRGLLTCPSGLLVGKCLRSFSSKAPGKLGVRVTGCWGCCRSVPA